jgi:replicative DNA helicase
MRGVGVLPAPLFYPKGGTLADLQKPYALDTEREVLTACFKGGSINFSREDIVTHVISSMEPETYEHPHHKKIFVAMAEAVRDAGNAEVEWGDVRDLIDSESQARKTLRDIVTDETTPPTSKKWLERNVEKLNDLQKCRTMYLAQKNIERKALAGDISAYQDWMDAMFTLGRDRFQTGAQPIGHYIDDIHEEVKQRRNNKGIVGLETGIYPLDHVFGGLQNKKLYYVGGRPGMMKSVVCGQVASSVAERGHRVILASPEMSAEDYTMRLACKMADIDFNHYNRGSYTEAQEKLLHEALELLRNKNIIINESGLQNIGTLRQDVIRFQPSLLILDYGQLFEPSRPKYNDFSDLTMFSKELNAMKKDFGIPILSALQLSRKVEERPINQRRPIKSDLRATGQFEQDADGIMMLYREREYSTQDEAGIWWIEDSRAEGGQREADPETLEFVCAKNRHGSQEDIVTYVKEGELFIRNEREC